MNNIQKAEYKDTLISQYNGNPLIEALPPILSPEEVVERMENSPQMYENERSLQPHLKCHCVEKIFQYFQPLVTHIEIEQRFSRLIRQGYVYRSPFESTYSSDLNEIYISIKEKDSSFQNSNLSYQNGGGFSIIGFSGMGKTSAVNKVLSLYPQVIIHEEYKGVSLYTAQIVWMKLECPHDGSIKALCTQFFSEFDRIMSDNTYYKFASRRATIDEMIPQMSQIARRHHLGVLVIDEIQHLSEAKSGGASKMLSFFVNLTNTIGIPIVLIGTTKALHILQGDFRQARRGSGNEGDLVWENMKKDDSWDLLIEGIWKYQWLKNVIPYTKKLSEVMYDESQGIVDVAIKLFAMSQISAINNGEEELTIDRIRKTSSERIKFLQPMLAALRNKDIKALSKYSDIMPIDFDSFMKESRELAYKKLLLKNKSNSSLNQDLNNKSTKNSSINNEEQIADKDKDLNKGGRVNKNISQKETKESKNGTSKNEEANADLTLIDITKKGKKADKTAYQSLKESGIIKNPLDEFAL